LGNVFEYPIAQEHPVPLPRMAGKSSAGRFYVPGEWPIARSLASNEVVIDEEIQVLDPAGRARGVFAARRLFATRAVRPWPW